jgi:carbon monoxide dehydrogenase subunit G
VAASPEAVWRVLVDVENFAGRVPMLSKVVKKGELVGVDLKFRITLFSVGFRFVARAIIDEGKRLELVYVSGEPKDMRLTLEVEPTPAGSRLITTATFDLYSLGWVVKYFLKHHPEIQCGVYPGVAIALHTHLGRAAAGS